MTGTTSQRIEIDRDACMGHGRCYAVAPEIFEPDDEGYSVVIGDADDDQLRDELDMAVRNCPERAVLVSTED